MIGGSDIWLETAFDWKLINILPLICKAFQFLACTMSDYSVLIILIITVEKFYAVSYPYKASQVKFCKKRLRIIFFSALFICSIINSYFLFSLKLIEVNSTIGYNASFNNPNTLVSICTYSKWNYFYANSWPYINATIYSFLPFSMISIQKDYITLKSKFGHSKFQQ